MNDDLKKAVELLTQAIELLKPQIIVGQSDIERIGQIKTRIENKIKKTETRIQK